MAQNVKTVQGVAIASVKTVQSVAIASVKTIQGVDNTGGGGALLTNLISYWKMDEASGTRVDAHGTNDLTDNNTVGSAAGKINDAGVYASANSEFLDHADNASLSTGNIDYTITCWIFPTTLGSDRIILAKDESGQREYALDFHNASTTLRYYINGGSVIVSSDPIITTNTWFFVCIWHDATADTINIQLNDETPISQSTGGTPPDDTTADFSVGARDFSGFEQYFDGKIDEVGFWKRVLTSQERADLYNSGAGLSYDNF